MLRKLLVLTVALLAGLAAAQDMESSPLMLLTMPEVKKELKLSGEQNKKLGAINKNYQNKMRDMARSAARDPDAADKMERLEQETAMDSLAVLTPDQSKRLTQIQYQVLGGTSLYIPAVQKQLGLSEGQIAKIREVGDPEDTRISDIISEGAGDVKSRRKKIREIKAARDAAIYKLLADEQMAKLKELQGPPSEAAKKLAERDY